VAGSPFREGTFPFKPLPRTARTPPWSPGVRGLGSVLFYFFRSRALNGRKTFRIFFRQSASVSRVFFLLLSFPPFVDFAGGPSRSPRCFSQIENHVLLPRARSHRRTSLSFWYGRPLGRPPSPTTAAKSDVSGPVDSRGDFFCYRDGGVAPSFFHR